MPLRSSAIHNALRCIGLGAVLACTALRAHAQTTPDANSNPALSSANRGSDSSMAGLSTPGSAAAAAKSLALPRTVSTSSSGSVNPERVSAGDRLAQADAQADVAEWIPVRLTAQQHGITFYARVGSGFINGDVETVMIDGDAYQKLCEAPCNAKLRQGRNHLALSYHGADPIAVAKELTLYQPATFSAEYESYGLRRLLGGALVAAGGTGAVALVMTAPDCNRSSNDLSNPVHCSDLQKWIGLGVGVVSAVVGVSLVLKTDVADVTLVPGLASPSTPTLRESAPGNGAYALRGLSIFARF